MDVVVIGLIGGVAALVVLAFVRARQLPARIAANGKHCPDCQSRVPVDANVCRFCGFRW